MASEQVTPEQAEAYVRERWPEAHLIPPIPIPEDLERAFITATSNDADAYSFSCEFVASLIERIAAAEQRVKKLEDESDALRATVERLTRPVTDEERVEFKRKEMYRGGTLKALTSFIAARAKDTWKQGEGDPAIFQDAEGRN